MKDKAYCLAKSAQITTCWEPLVNGTAAERRPREKKSCRYPLLLLKDGPHITRFFPSYLISYIVSCVVEERSAGGKTSHKQLFETYQPH